VALLQLTLGMLSRIDGQFFCWIRYLAGMHARIIRDSGLLLREFCPPCLCCCHHAGIISCLCLMKISPVTIIALATPLLCFTADRVVMCCCCCITQAS
jgi:hypothetical protein